MLASVMLLFGFANTSAISDPGTSARFWDNGQTVLYAEVLDTVSDKTWFSIRFKPLATIAGKIDPAFTAELSANAWIGSSMVSSINSPPTKGAKVVFVVLPRNSEHEPYFIPNGDAAFFPTNARGNQPCLFEVTGFDDPKVMETIENLRKLRGKQREEAEKAKADAEKDKAAQKPSAGKK